MKRRIVSLIAIVIISLCLISKAQSHFDYVGGRKVINAYKATIKKYLKVGSDSAATVDKSEDLYVEDDIECGGNIVGAANIGIGLTNPWQELTVAGDVTISDATPNLTFRDSTDDTAYQFHVDTSADPWDNFALFRGTDDGSIFTIGLGGVPLMQFDDSNNFVLPQGNFRIDADGNISFANSTSSWKEITMATKWFTLQSIFSGADNDMITYLLAPVGKSMSLQIAANGGVGDYTPYLNLKADYARDLVEITTDVDIALMPTGNVGIGTTNPSVALDVSGAITASGDGTFDGLNFVGSGQDYKMGRDSFNNLYFQGQTSGLTSTFAVYNAAGDGSTGTVVALFDEGSPSSVVDSNYMQFGLSTSSGKGWIAMKSNGSGTPLDLQIFADGGGQNQLYLKTDGNVGIGTSAPWQELTVSGDVTISDANPNLTFRDATDDTAYQFHVETHTDSDPWTNFSLWRGTDDGSGFTVGPDVPLMYFDDNDDVHFLNTIFWDTFNPAVYTKDEVNDIVEGASFDFFLNDTSSDIGGYFVMDPTETGDAESPFTDTITNDAFLIDTFATSTSEPTFTELMIGIYSLHIHADTTTGANVGTAVLYFELYKRTHPGGVETLLITSEESSVLTGTKTAVEVHGPLTSDTVLDSTDRLIVKIYANIETSRPQDPDVTFYAEGTLASRFEVKTTISAFDNRYILQLGDTTGAMTSKMNMDDGTFVISYDDNRVGIGLTNPSVALDVSGDITASGRVTQARYTLTGNAEQDYLTVNRVHNTGLLGSVSGKSVGFELWSADGDGTDTNQIIIWNKGSPSDISNSDGFQFQNSTNALKIKSFKVGNGILKNVIISADGTETQIVLETDGDVGIGTSTPSVALDVAGAITASGAITGKGYTLNLVTKTGAYTLTANDDIVLVSGTTTLTLPTASGIAGKVYTIKNINTGRTVVTVDGNASETIDGELTWTSLSPDEAINIVSDGTNWRIF